MYFNKFFFFSKLAFSLNNNSKSEKFNTMNLREPSCNLSSKVITNCIIVSITCTIWSYWSKEIKIHRTRWLQAFFLPQRANITQCSNHLPQRAEILTQRSNLTPQQAEDTANDLNRFGHKAGLIYTVHSFLLRPANCSRQFTPNKSIFV